MVISKGNYGHGEFKNVLPYSVQIQYLPVRDRKLLRVMRGNIGSRKQTCENSGRKIPMVPHLHQSNGYMKRKLRAWRVQKCISLVGADTVVTSAGPQTTRVMGGNIGSRNEICENSGLPIPIIPILNQSNGYIKNKLRAWRVQKCIALVGADTVLSSAGP